MHTAAPLRLIAAFEAAKGAIVLAAGCGLLALVHQDLQAIAERLVRHSHLNPASHYPRIFIDAAAHASHQNLWMLAGLAALYTALRFVEAYGLWFARRWAEWLAALSGGVYIPIELYEFAHRPHALQAVILLINVAVVAYLSRALWTGRRTH
jgi:uncharacterized membrane protein (DUF2068 family)